MRFGTALFFLLFLSISCSKDKYASKPQLTLKEMSGNYVPKGAGLQFTIEFTDAEGDLTGAVGIQKISSTCDLASYIDTLKFVIPSFPATQNQKGDLLITLESIDLVPIECNGQDTVEQATFKFWVKDKGGNISDTLTAPPVTILK
ncbi:MAG: hypothetical protein C5B52_17145 [Bacteroidetes bacterium]|nr:MAG: hypothetical protein C5B52_17145 [Bacteroidota bacterium]